MAVIYLSLLHADLKWFRERSLNRLFENDIALDVYLKRHFSSSSLMSPIS
jgi:hypothetical protein